MEKRRPLGGEVPGRRSTAQSYDRGRGRDVALVLQKTSPRSWYLAGTVERSGGSREGAECFGAPACLSRTL